MIANIVSDDAFFSLPQTWIRASAINYLRGKDEDKINGSVDLIFQTIKKVVSFAFEAKTSRVYLGTKNGCPFYITCIELGHLQPQNGTPFSKLIT